MGILKHINTIVTHHQPHLDEISAIWLILRFGTEIFPGVESAEIISTKSGGEELNGTPEKLEEDGFLLIGIGGGRFDEHPGGKSKGVEGKCCFDLVLEAMGLQDDPSFSQIIRFVRNTDLKGVSQPFDLASLVKAMNAKYPDPKMVIDWTMKILDAKYDQQVSFLRAKEALEKTATKYEISKGDKTLTLMVGKTDDKEFSKACRANGAAVVIQQWQRGNVMIFTNKSKEVKLGTVVGRIRKEEQGFSGKPKGQEDLFAEGSILGWYYHTEGQMLLNGSIGHSEIPPTKISLERIIDIVRYNIKVS